MVTLKAYIASHVFQFFLSLLLLTSIIFFVVRILPGDPARLAMGPWAPEEEVEKFRHEMGFDKPLYIQYMNFLKGLFLEGKAGKSLMTYHDALSDVLYYFPATFELSTVAMILGFIVGVLFGVFSAVYRNTLLDYLVRLFATAGAAVPDFWFGILLQLFMAYWLSFFPVSGRLSSGILITRITGLNLIDSILTGSLIGFVDSVRHLVLPAVVLATPVIANISRITRGSMLDELSKDYIDQAYVNGLPGLMVIFKHALKNASSAILTAAGMQYAWLLGGIFVVETVFGWPGFASYGASAALRKDINGVVAVCFVLVFVHLVVNMSVGFLHLFMDPRLRARLGEKV